MNQFVMSDEDKADFHLDEVRGRIRQEAASLYTVDETVQVVDSEGEIWDTLQGSLPADEWSPEVLNLSSEELAERAENARREAEEVERTETVIKPLVMKKIRAEARAEWVEKLREQGNEILKLRADLAKADRRTGEVENRLRGELVLKTAELGRVKAKLQEIEDRKKPAAGPVEGEES